MDSLKRVDSKEDSLNESWVELQMSGSGLIHEGPAPALSRPVLFSGQMEKLLLEAQRESSRSSSRQGSVTGSVTGSVPGSVTESITGSIASSRSSPKSPHSPNNEPASDFPIATIQVNSKEGRVLQAVQGTDWIWDWSSRPEAHPNSDSHSKYKHPKKSKLSVRNTVVMERLFCLENLPALLVTHLSSFLVGAAVMFIYLKKYVKLPAVTTHALLD
jgi:BCL2/adenovirus E1B protein-interacting protein 3